RAVLLPRSSGLRRQATFRDAVWLWRPLGEKTNHRGTLVTWRSSVRRITRKREFGLTSKWDCKILRRRSSGSRERYLAPRWSVVPYTVVFPREPFSSNPTRAPLPITRLSSRKAKKGISATAMIRLAIATSDGLPLPIFGILSEIDFPLQRPITTSSTILKPRKMTANNND